MDELDRAAIYRLHAGFCKNLADPNRLLIIDVLGEAELSVGEIVRRLKLPQSNVSKHLALMREIDCLSMERPFFGTRKVQKRFGIKRNRSRMGNYHQLIPELVQLEPEGILIYEQVVDNRRKTDQQDQCSRNLCAETLEQNK